MSRRDEAEFWRAIEMAAGSPSAADLADVGRYVASRGAGAVASFDDVLKRTIERLREVGVADQLSREGRTNDGRAIADLAGDDIDPCLEAVLVSRRFFEALLTNPELARGPKTVPLVDLRQAVKRAQREPGIERTSLWVEKPGDRRRAGCRTGRH